MTASCRVECPHPLRNGFDGQPDLTSSNSEKYDSFVRFAFDVVYVVRSVCDIIVT